MSEYGIDGPPEQDTNSTRANTRANDKWAQEGTHGPKGEVGGPTGRPADLLVGRQAHGPHHLNIATWCSLTGSQCRFCREELRSWGGSLL